MEKFDVVVIGAGLGGLSAAAYLARAGKKVLVLEQHTVPGGYAHEFRRGKFRFEVALHALDGAAPGGWSYPVLKDLGVFEQVRFERMDPFYTLRLPGRELTAHADVALYEAELVKHFPHEREGIQRLIADMQEVYWQVRRLDAEGQKGIRPPVEQMPARYPRMLAAMSLTLEEYLSQFVQDAGLKAAFCALWGYYGLPPQQLNAATFIFPWVSYHVLGAWYPVGGSMAISRALEADLKAHGGEIRYRQLVQKIELAGGRARAVLTEQGLRAEAELVISNANAPDTLLKFIGAEHLPAAYAQRVQQGKPSISNLVVYLGLERDLLAEGYSQHELFIMEDTDLAGQYRAALDGDFARSSLAITHYNPLDPGCAPQGSSVLSIFAAADWNSFEQWGTAGQLEGYQQNPRYQQAKQAAAELLLSRVEKIIPGLRQSIRYMEVATPLTNWRYSRNPGGAIYGTEQTLENTFSGRLSPRTPVENLLLAGAWTFGGGMSAAMISGRDAARMALGVLDGAPVTLMSPEIGASADAATQPAPAVPQPNSAPASTGLAPVPDVALHAAVSGRALRLSAPGQATLLIIHSAESAEAAEQLNRGLRIQHGFSDSQALLIASLVDLHSVPRLFRSFAEKSMRDSYNQAAANLPAGEDPASHILIFPDWDGSLTRAFGFSDPSKQVGVALLRSDGSLQGTYQGSQPLAQVLRWLGR